MTSNLRIWMHAAAAVALVALPAVLLSAERRAVRNAGEAAANAEEVEMFAAMRSGDIDVKLIPKDETEARVIIKNNTGKPLSVKLPETFAGVPVLAQRAGAGVGGNRGGGAGNTGANQAMGGGMGGMGMGGMGGGFMSVPPEKLRQFKVATVCLEHGKPNPRPHIPYGIKPLAEFTSSPQVKELLTAFGKGNLDQRATQAAAWHLANDLSWDELAAKRIDHLVGPDEPWFSPQEIRAGVEIANFAKQQAALNSDEGSRDAASFSRSAESE